MNRQQLIDIIDADLKRTQKIRKITLIISSIVTFAGLIFFTLKGKNNFAIGFACSIMGGMFLLISGLGELFKSAEKSAEYAKNIIWNTPNEMIWAYQFTQKTNGSVTRIDAVLKFRGGKSISINNSQLPNRDVQSFLRALPAISPSVILGYTGELEKAYKKNLL
jgi:hypothetical protein